MPRSARDDSPAAAPFEPLAPQWAVPGECASYVWQNVIVSVWFGRMSLAGLASHEQGLRQQWERHPQGLSSINLLVPGRHMLPPAEVREELKRITDTYTERVQTSALVVPGSGFWASAVRGVTTALSLVTTRELKLAIFSTSSEVVAWLPALHAQRTGVTLPERELAALLTRIERAIPELA